jgi:superfamily II DNA or RNA helicase
MSLQAILSGWFDLGVRSRGAEVFRRGMVNLQEGSASQVRAQVHGSSLYEVDLTLRTQVLEVDCECPYFWENGPCKHLWATILACDRQGYLGDALSKKNLQLYPDDFELDGLAEDDFPDSVPMREWQPGTLHRTANTRQKPSSRWKMELQAIQQQLAWSQPPHEGPWPTDRELLYAINVAQTVSTGSLTIEFQARDRKKNGEWTKPVKASFLPPRIRALPEPDRELVATLLGTHAGPYYYGPASAASSCVLLGPLADRLIPMLCATGRCVLFDQMSQERSPLLWRQGERWQFRLRLEREKKNWALRGFFRSGELEMDLKRPVLVTEGGFIFYDGKAALLDHGPSLSWLIALRRNDGIGVPDDEGCDFVTELLAQPNLPPLDLPEELRFEEIRLPLRPSLRIKARPSAWAGQQAPLDAELRFLYGDRELPHHDQRSLIVDKANRRMLVRDWDGERSAVSILTGLGVRPNAYARPPVFQLPATKLPGVVQSLTGEGWIVEADGKLFRNASSVRIEVVSGIDWFELHGAVSYDDGGTSSSYSVALPELLKAVHKKQNMVRLDDGSFGVLPEEWLKRFKVLSGLGETNEDHLRFVRGQAGLLDALLAERPEATFDSGFRLLRERLRTFEGIQPAAQPEGFQGQLRGYQLEGLAWFAFLREFAFGGCLADDMGVGKTAQVLALLEARRQAGASGGPSLVVAPRSLIFNWQQEAARFTPMLRLLDHSGTSRSLERLGERFREYDIVLTTYGVLRRDVPALQNVEFDYVVLDEAQAIKNQAAESAKAVRLLRGRHRLALTGTPVENHLGELWSLFEFLNPGMLGAASVFKSFTGSGRNPDPAGRALLARSLRPFILRRTKEQVVSELPRKMEQTLYCELEAAQRKLYNELRDHYRGSLMRTVEQRGLARSKIQVLEALLRLRQAACHPGLLDPLRQEESSAKLDMLLHQLDEVLDEGHKALVFSQFTSFLALLRRQLDRRKTTYEYLDGKTRDRQARVEKFQSDPDSKLFLISLKAGGLGLNLTAADYVFLLDPWWNPAVEAQAIDRTHRIGQNRRVFAYRLIARDTVEEKVLELQKSKRDLADAILNEDNSVLGKLSREDLELLLS